VVISSPSNLALIRQCYRRPWFADAPHVLAVKGYPDLSWVHPKSGYNSIETDLAIAMDHMILAAANEGVGTCWIIAFDPDCLKKALRLKGNEVVFAITPLGYPGPEYIRREKTRKDLESITRFI
jgi:nitroreductase